MQLPAKMKSGDAVGRLANRQHHQGGLCPLINHRRQCHCRGDAPRAGKLTASVTWQGKPLKASDVKLQCSLTDFGMDHPFSPTDSGSWSSRTPYRPRTYSSWVEDSGRAIGLQRNEDGGVKSGRRNHLRVTTYSSGTGPRPTRCPSAQAHQECPHQVVTTAKTNVRSNNPIWAGKKVRENGSFEFRSLPPGNVSALALAEGWISKGPSNTSGSIVLPYPIPTDLAPECVIPMERTASCEIKVVDAKGQAAPGITIILTPMFPWMAA